jgi:hypothetical protein
VDVLDDLFGLPLTLGAVGVLEAPGDVLGRSHHPLESLGSNEFGAYTIIKGFFSIMDTLHESHSAFLIFTFTQDGNFEFLMYHYYYHLVLFGVDEKDRLVKRKSCQFQTFQKGPEDVDIVLHRCSPQNKSNNDGTALGSNSQCAEPECAA